jgi:hypothetical protein
VLEANPDYRGFTWDFQPSEPAWDDTLVKQMKGKKMPQVGRVEISIIEEPQSIWLAFENNELDYVNLPADFRARALAADGTLLPVFAKQGVKLYNAVDPDLTYTTFNFRDPVVGGFSKEKIALRRAIVMAYDIDSEIRILRKNLVIRDEMPIPPGVVGYEPGYKAVDQYDPILANKLLDHFGYKVGADGWRTMPDGKPLVLPSRPSPARRAVNSTSCGRSPSSAVKIKVVFDIAPSARTSRRPRPASWMMWGQAWTADFPRRRQHSCKLLYGPTPARATTAATSPRPSTRSTRRRGSCPIPRSGGASTSR